MSGEIPRLVGRDPLNRFLDASPEEILRSQGVHQTLTKNPAPPMPEIQEYIDEAPADSTAPIYESRYPDRNPPPPTKSTRTDGWVAFDPTAFRPIGSRKARR